MTIKLEIHCFQDCSNPLLRFKPIDSAAAVEFISLLVEPKYSVNSLPNGCQELFYNSPLGKIGEVKAALRNEKYISCATANAVARANPLAHAIELISIVVPRTWWHLSFWFHSFFRPLAALFAPNGVNVKVCVALHCLLFTQSEFGTISSLVAIHLYAQHRAQCVRLCSCAHALNATFELPLLLCACCQINRKAAAGDRQ